MASELAALYPHLFCQGCDRLGAECSCLDDDLQRRDFERPVYSRADTEDLLIEHITIACEAMDWNTDV